MEPEVTEVEAQRVAIIRRTVSMDELPAFYDGVFGAVPAAVEAAGGTLTGPAFGWYHGKPTETVDLAGGFPVDGVAVGSLGGGDVEVVERPGGRAVVLVHVGSYETLADSYRVLESFLGSNGLEPRHDMWEEYLTNPAEEPDTSDWQTRLVMPLR